jgi:hypothetical protein
MKMWPVGQAVPPAVSVLWGGPPGLRATFQVAPFSLRGARASAWHEYFVGWASRPARDISGRAVFLFVGQAFPPAVSVLWGGPPGLRATSRLRRFLVVGQAFPPAHQS